MIVNVHEAKTQLSKLIEAALRGEEVTIARAGKPVVRLVPTLPVARKFVLAPIPELVGIPSPDFLEPMSEEELRDWE